MNDAPMWLQLSLVSFVLGAFVLLLFAGFWIIESIPPLERFLERLLGEDE